MTPRYDINATSASRMLSHMFAMQNRANSAVNPDWHLAGNRWSRAIMVEGVELLEHYGRWKWWKKQNTQPDLFQCQLELVDIWHFALSYFMVRFENTDASDWVLNEAVMRRIKIAQAKAENLVPSDEAFNAAVDALVGAAAQNLFDTDAFFALCAIVELPLDKLYAQYVGKNLLHVFRQQYGYKTGRYLKEWSGVEDNIVLENVMSQFPHLAGEELEESLKQELLARYTKACTADNWQCLETPVGPVIGKVGVLASAPKLGPVLSTRAGIVYLDKPEQVLRPLPIFEA